MSLYADEDLAVVQDTGAGPSTSSSTAPIDPVNALSNALTCTPESVAQAEAFLAAGQRFEENPEKLPDLCNQLLPMIVDGGESLLRAWTLDMVALTVGRSGLNVSIKEDGESFVKRWQRDMVTDV
jgi:symplekin